MPALDERAFNLQRQLPDLGVQGLQIDYRFSFRWLAAEPVGRSREQLVFSVGALVGVQVKVLRHLGQRLVASNDRQCHLGFECR